MSQGLHTANRRRLAALLVAALVSSSAPPALWAGAGGTCSVPGTHPLIQEAVDDLTCTEVTLLAQVYTETILVQRTLGLRGPISGGAVLQGQVRAIGAEVQLDLVDLAVHTGCKDGVLVAGGAAVAGAGLSALRSPVFPCPPAPDAIFQDGFESGETNQWSNTTGGVK